MKRLLMTATCLGLASVASAQMALEDFESGTFPPAGWTVVDNLGNGTWDTSSAFSHGNGAGTGEAAAIDSDNYGGVDIDGELLTPLFDVPATGYALDFDHYFNFFLTNEIGDVDISIDGGISWVNLASYTLMDYQEHASLSLDAYAGMTGLQVRFHYYQANYDWYWQVDNVEVLLPPPPPPPPIEVWSEDFESGVWPPAGWTVIDNLGNGAWDSLAFWNQTNYTGGTGECECIDSDEAGSVDVDTELITPAFDVPVRSSYFGFRNEFNWYSGGNDEVGNVDITVDGGATWINLLHFQGADNSDDQELDLSAYAGQNVQIRFHYFDANYEMWWQVDDVGVYMDGGLGTQYCFGDNPSNCPCGNGNDGSLPLGGCANGVFASGANLAGSGVASLSADTLILSTTGLQPTQSGLYFQANNDLGSGIVWGDGLQCAGGGLIRLGVRQSDSTGYSDTTGYAYTISARSATFGHAIAAGDTLYYQCWYRNPNGSPCGSDFNSSNGLAVTWTQ
jgi:hypothetical protein